MNRHNGTSWPDRPERWADTLTETEACQYLRIDEFHRTPTSGIRSLRHLRKKHGLPYRTIGRESQGIAIVMPRDGLREWVLSGNGRADPGPDEPHEGGEPDERKTTDDDGLNHARDFESLRNGREFP